jgi:hypothetical protein
MKLSHSLRRAAGSILLTFALGATARATVVVDVSSAITLTDPTQLGRLSRNGIVQDWTNTEPFPGVINTTTSYHYHTFVVNPFTASLGPFMQITFDSLSANTFVSAYYTSYVPDSPLSGNFGFDTHWLGDEGSSGDFFGTDPSFFQVTVPVGDSLVIVVNQTAAGTAGIGDPFHLLVESFTDTEFTDAPTAPPVSAVPEPSAYGLFGAAMVVGLGLWRRLRSQRSSHHEL